MKVLISLGKSFYEVYPELGTWLRKEGIEVVEQVGYDYEPPKRLIKELIADAEVYVVGVDRVDREIIESAPRLKLIIKHGVGVDNIDLLCAKEHGIAVVYARGCNAQSVAELTISLMLCVSRGIPKHSEEVRNGGWRLFMGTELRGKVLGLIGYGNIGSRVATIALAFGMKVVAYDPYVEENVLLEAGIHPQSLEELLREADYVSLHVPSIEENWNMINANTLSLMKTSAYLINTSRGELIDEEALKEALRMKRIRGVALDVFKKEPPDPELLSVDEAVFTPHLGGCTVDSAKNLSLMTFQNIINYKNNQPLLNRLV